MRYTFAALLLLLRSSASELPVVEFWRTGAVPQMLELWFSPTGEFFAGVGAEDVVVFNSEGAERFRLPKRNSAGFSHGRSIAFSQSGDLLVWESPNRLRAIRPLDGAEVWSREAPIPPKPAMESPTRAFFSPNGAVIAVGWYWGKDVFVLSSETFAPRLLLSYQTESIWGASLMQFDTGIARMGFSRQGLGMGEAYLSLFDLNQGIVNSYPYQFEYCPTISATTPRSITITDFSEGNWEICRGVNLVDEINTREARLSESGKFLALRGAIADLNEKRLLTVSKAIENPGGVALPPTFFWNCTEKEAFAVWESTLIAGYDLETFDGKELFSMRPPWPEFTWFTGSSSPDRRLIVVQARINGEFKLVGIENPFFRPILKSAIATGESLRLEWAGGKPPYRVLVSRILNDESWVEAGAVSERALTVPFEGSQSYYVVTSRGD